MEELTVLIVPVIASVLANFIEIRPDDAKWKRKLKKAINLLAINFSEKAGK